MYYMHSAHIESATRLPVPRICAGLVGLALTCTFAVPVAAVDVRWLPDIEESASALPSTSLYDVTGDLTSFQADPWLAHWTAQDPAALWLPLTSELVTKYRLAAPRASRVFAYVTVAINDAAQLARKESLSAAGQQAAVHAAASWTIALFFPNEPTGRFEALRTSAISAAKERHSKDSANIQSGAELGMRIYRANLLRALSDGADEVWDARARPRPTPTSWRATPPMDTAQPQEPLAGRWRMWLPLEPSESIGASPPDANSPTWMRQAREVLTVSKKLTPSQKKIAIDWHLDQGTVTPPGVWNRKAMTLAAQHRISGARLYAMLSTLNVAMMDATIACWRVKYEHWVRRPITLIRERLDSNFTPILITPMHPSYPSGHACVSGAAAEVLKNFLPAEAKTVNGWAAEAALSRLYGGIHFRIDNEEGLKLGKRIGKRIVASIEKASGRGRKIQGTDTTMLR